MVLMLQTFQNISTLLLASLKHIKYLTSLLLFLHFMKEPEKHLEVSEYFLQLSSNIDAASKKTLQCCLPSLIQSLDHFLDNFSNVTFAQKTTCTISQNREWYQCCYIVLNLIWNIVHFLQQEQRLYSNIIVIIILISNTI